jgi:two-component system OmpR family response regulator
MPKIFLAEDDYTMLSLLRTLLKLEGYTTTAPLDTEDVLEAVHREQPDVILMDVHLTQGNGIDILRAIRQDHRLDSTLVLMQSGMNLETECLAAGANGFLLKPYMPDALIGRLKQFFAA